MFEAFIPLNEALDNEKRRPVLIERLREGGISAYAPMVYSGQLIELHVAKSFEHIISLIYHLEVYRRIALRHLNEQNSLVKYIWDASSKRYFAIFESAPSDVAAYAGADRNPEGQAEIPKSFWRSAYIDGSRCSIVYDDWQDLWRTEYMRVHIDNKAIEAIDRFVADGKIKVGRHSILHQEIEQYALQAIKNQPEVLLYEFIKDIMDKFGPAAGVYNTVNKHYGNIWRQHADRMCARTQKPK